MALNPPIVISNNTLNLRAIDKINSFIAQFNDIGVSQLTPLTAQERNFIDNEKYRILADKINNTASGITISIPKEAYNNNTELDYIVSYVNENLTIPPATR